MDLEIAQCLTALPPFAAQMEEYRQARTCDLNLIEWFIMRIKQFLEFLRVLMGTFLSLSLSLSGCVGVLVPMCVCVSTLIGIKRLWPCILLVQQARPFVSRGRVWYRRVHGVVPVVRKSLAWTLLLSRKEFGSLLIMCKKPVIWLDATRSDDPVASTTPCTRRYQTLPLPTKSLARQTSMLCGAGIGCVQCMYVCWGGVCDGLEISVVDSLLWPVMSWSSYMYMTYRCTYTIVL